MQRTIDIFIINFNTNDLLNACIYSITSLIKNFDFAINIFDNSTSQRFQLSKNNCSTKVNIIDNTTGNIINFKDVENKYAKNMKFSQNNAASLKHTYTIDYIIKNLAKEDFLLMDSDVILKKDVDFIDPQFITIAGIGYGKSIFKTKFFPFIQYFNTSKIKQQNISYFDPNRIMFGYNFAGEYNTGASFYEDVVKCGEKFKEINFEDYVFHLGSGSWASNPDRNIDFIKTSLESLMLAK